MKRKPSRWWYVLPALPFPRPLYGERVEPEPTPRS
jgi:hypothetical protein